MKTYLFYDVETTGLNPAFDQILTFAAIRTDLSLNEIDRQTITVRLRKDIVPSPMAFLTHGLTMEELQAGVSEYQAARQIHALMNTPGTISVGYNSLGFDDEFLRFSFYRNLLDPYTHQYSNGCSRVDILPITTLYKVFHPEGIEWPEIDGKTSLKLDLIARANGFVTSGRAHEAMNDVEALIELAKKLYQHPKIWEYCLDFFNKTRDDARIASMERSLKIDNTDLGLAILVSASFGSDAKYIAPAVNIGQSIPYKNQSLWLRLDSEDILGVSQQLSLEETFVVRKRSADALIVLPALDRFWEKMPSETRKLAKKNVEIIKNNVQRFLDFCEYHTNYKHPFIPQVDADAGLYQEGFFSKSEKSQIETVHKALGQGQMICFEQIVSPRVKLLSKRVVSRNFDTPYLDETDFKECLRLDALPGTDTDCSVVGYRNDTKLTCKEALLEIGQLEKETKVLEPEQTKMLEWLKGYVEQLQISSAQSL